MTVRSEFRWGPRALSPRNYAPERGLMGGEGPGWTGGPNQTDTRVSRRADVHGVLVGAVALAVARGIVDARIGGSSAAVRDRITVHYVSLSQRATRNACVLGRSGR